MSALKPLLAKVADGKSLTRDEAVTAFNVLMSGEATPSQIGAFLMALRVRGETVMRSLAPSPSCAKRCCALMLLLMPSISSAPVVTRRAPTTSPPALPSSPPVRA